MNTNLNFEENPIELLGTARNSIVKTRQDAQLPSEYSYMLGVAYALIREVQEYLFEH